MKGLNKYLLLCSSVLLGSALAHAQLTVSGAKTPTELVEDVLLGTGVTASNITYTGDVVARGEFNGVGSNIGFDAGVILTSGSINNAPGPNNSPSTSRNNGEPGDSDIDAIISPIPSRDAAVLEFDFRPISDTIMFNYVFASEEYPEYAPPNSSSFNDAFAFLLTGPNPAGGNYTNTNIALIPGTSTPVSINNVNAVTNNSYYINNGNGFQFPFNSSTFYVEYDGFTVPLTAIAPVVPCATYHIKLVVADAFDRVYDSGVFLEANSFGSTVNNPTIDFASTTPSCTGDTVSFINTGSSGPGILFDWDFGTDATPATSTQENPTNISYSTPGLKLITMSMNVNCGDTTLKLMRGVTIDETPAPAFTSNAPQCQGQPVNFNYTGTLDPSWTYQWDFGSGANPSTSFAQNPANIVYNTPGTKTVTLTVRNGNCLESISQTITINARPSASFTSNDPVGVGYGVDFTNTGTTGASYSWNFGSGSSPATSTNENPSGVTYGFDGSKTVSLITTASGCADTATGQVSIITTPNPSFTSNAPQPVGFPLLFAYTGNSNSNFTFSWDFGSGASPATSTSKNPPAVFYSTPGTKTVTLTVRNGSIVIVFTQTIVIDNPPISSFTSSAPNCQNAGIDFQSNAVTGSTFNWDFGTGATPATSNSANPTGITYSTPGFKTVRLITTLGGDSDTSEQTIYIIEQPQASFTHNGPQCEGAPINLTYTGNNGSNWTYTWDFGNGASPALSSAQQPSGIQYSGSGSKTVTVNVSNSFCTDTSTQVITINPTPDANFNLPVNACSGDTIQVVNTGTSGAIYTWDFGSNASPSTSTNTDENLVYSSHGIQNIRQVVSLGACADTAYGSISISERPQPAFTTNSPLCEGDELSLTYTGTGNPNWNFIWDFGNGAFPAMSANPSPQGVLYQGSGSRMVELTVSNGVCSDSASLIVNVQPTPDAGFASTAPSCTGDSISFSNTGTSGGTYAWDFGPGAVPATSSDENPQNVYFPSAGIKRIRQVSSLGGCSDTAEVQVNILETPNPSFTNPVSACQGSLVQFTYTGSGNSNWTYAWDFGNGAYPRTSTSRTPPMVSYYATGQKTVQLSVSNQFCSETFTNTLQIDSTPAVSLSATGPACSGDSLQLLVNGASLPDPLLSYQWSFAGNPTFTSSWKLYHQNPGQFRAKVVATLSGCSDSSEVFVRINEKPQVSFTSASPVCQGEAINFMNTGSTGGKWNYRWDFGASAFPPVSFSEKPKGIKFGSPGMHKVIFKISNQFCSNLDSGFVEVLSLPNAEAGVDTIICADDCVPIGSGAEQGKTYSWFPAMGLDDANSSNPLACPLAEFTTFVVTVKDDTTSCMAQDTVRITMLPSALANAGPDVEVCLYDSIQIGAAHVEGQSYRWEPSAGLNDSSASSPLASPPVDDQIYTVYVSYQNCEEVSDQVTVKVRRAIADAGSDETIARGEKVELNASGGVLYEWTPGASLSNERVPNPMASPLETTTYVVTVTDVFNCTDDDSITVTVVNPALFLPSAFTPDGSGRNDVFRVRGEAVTEFEMTVFNRAGDVVYYSEDFYGGWDGRNQSSGEDLPKGAYYYRVKGFDENGEEVLLNGYVNLIR